MTQGIKRELENLSSFVEKQKALMSLYVSVHGCKPASYEEFDKWVMLYEMNQTSLNSRRTIK
jgi:hypothetical protein